MVLYCKLYLPRAVVTTRSSRVHGVGALRLQMTDLATVVARTATTAAGGRRVGAISLPVANLAAVETRTGAATVGALALAVTDLATAVAFVCKRCQLRIKLVVVGQQLTIPDRRRSKEPQDIQP